jgi:hypothetical protein
MLPSFRQFVPSTNVCLWPAWALLPQCSYTNAANPAGIELVKKLRAQTGAPIGDVKKALEKADSDIKVAYDVLRKMGIAAATKKSCRPASEVLSHLSINEGFHKFSCSEFDTVFALSIPLFKTPMSVCTPSEEKWSPCPAFTQIA